MASRNLNPDELLRRLREAEQRAAEAEERSRKANERADEAAERAAQAVADQAPTSFKQYIQLVQQQLVSTLFIEPNPALTATETLTSVNGKYYPLELCAWLEFAEEHNKTFNLLLELLSDKPLFPSKVAVQGIQGDLSPTSRQDEEDIRLFIRTAIERPAQRIIMAYFKETGNTDRFYFRNNAYSVENRDPEIYGDRDVPSPSKKVSPERKRLQIPDRWGICEPVNGRVRNVFVGEYKAAHQIRIEGFTQVLKADLPPKDLFQEVLQRKQSGTVNSDEEKIRERVAQVLCQAYHYMIMSGLLYGYIAAGETLVFLKIEKSAPQKLYFHLTPVVSKPSFHEIKVEQAPCAQLVTFMVLALRSQLMSPDWIHEAENCGISQWPLLVPSHLQHDIVLRPRNIDGETSESSEEEDDAADPDYNASSIRRSRFESQPSQQPQAGERRRSPRKRTTNQRPALAYCTQDCLLGLVQGLPLDLNCPNVALHQRRQSYKQHLITKEELCSLLTKQLARSLDRDCDCLDGEGLFGRIGVLFKITLTKYGYTFVAKGVQRVDELCLADEASVYAHLSHLQGKRVPVYLGNITLERPYPLVSLARVTQMMLMSWAGCSLRVKSWPEDLDIELEKEKTLQALTSSRVSHEDIRNANLLWNPEKQLVMAIDFDQSIIYRRYKRKPSPSASPTRSRKPRTAKTREQPKTENSGKENIDPNSLED